MRFCSCISSTWIYRHEKKAAAGVAISDGLVRITLAGALGFPRLLGACLDRVNEHWRTQWQLHRIATENIAGNSVSPTKLPRTPREL